MLTHCWDSLCGWWREWLPALLLAGVAMTVVGCVAALGWGLLWLGTQVGAAVYAVESAIVERGEQIRTLPEALVYCAQLGLAGFVIWLVLRRPKA